jgi:hypothetical protein
MAPFGYADKQVKKHYWLICCERKILFQLKNKLKSTDYKPDEQDQCSVWTEWAAPQQPRWIMCFASASLAHWLVSDNDGRKNLKKYNNRGDHMQVLFFRKTLLCVLTLIFF